MFDRPPELKNGKKEDFFESKNATKQTYFVNGTQVEAIDIKPEKQKDEVPILVVPGWGATMESFKPGMQILAEKNRRVVSLDQPRKGGKVPEFKNAEIKEWYEKNGKEFAPWSDEEFRKANTILGLLDQKGLKKVDVIAHSEGAINVCMAAMLDPEKFSGRTIVLYSPAGLIGKDTLLRLQKGAGANKSRTETISHLPETEAEKEYIASTTHITPDYLKANPLRAIKELVAISRAQIEDMLRYLKEKSVKIVVMAAVDDTMFPQDRMQENVKSDFVDGYLSVQGGHMQIQTHPELFMAAAETMITTANAKK